MSVLRLLFREIAHRYLDFVLALIAVVAAVTLFVGIRTFSTGMQRETVRLVRDMGFNVLIMPEDTDMALFWADDYIPDDMPEQKVYDLANSKAWTVRHLEARLQKRIEWRGLPVLLTGILPEIAVRHRQLKSPKGKMGLKTEEARAFVGHTIHSTLGLKQGDTVEINGRELTVAKCLPRRGTKQDIRLYTHLSDAQAILGRPDRINLIEALNCQCVVKGDEDIDALRLNVGDELKKLLGGVEVELIGEKARARQRTRQSVDRWAAVIFPVLLLACAAWVGHLTAVNVRDRRHEIGVLRAIGVSGWKVAFLFVARAVLIGLIGALIGYALGTWLAVHFGPRLFPLTGKKIAPLGSLLLYSVIGAPVLCVLASYIPTMLAVSQDPAEALKEE